MVLRKIVHHITPAIHRARAFTEDERQGCQKSKIAFKTSKGTEYDNVEWLSTERNERIETWRYEESPAPVIVVTPKRPDIIIFPLQRKRVW